MKVSARYKKVTVYPFGDFYITLLYRNKSLNPIQFGAPSKDMNKNHIKSLLKHYGFELVNMKDLPE